MYVNITFKNPNHRRTYLNIRAKKNEGGVEMYVVASKVKELVKSEGMNMASDFSDALSKKVEELVKAAAARAKGNGRKTVRAIDL